MLDLWRNLDKKIAVSVFAAWFLSFAMIWMVILSTVFRINQLFELFDAELPLTVRLVNDFGNLFAEYWYIFAPVILILSVLIAGGVAMYVGSIRNRLWRLSVYALAILLPALIVVFFWGVLIYFPLQSLLEVL